MIDLRHPDRFVTRHLGPRDADLTEMLAAVKAPSLEALVDETVPESIRLRRASGAGRARGNGPRLRASRGHGLRDGRG